MDSTKASAAEVAHLRAEMRRRKILERGEERMRKLFKESQDDTNQSNQSESMIERNRNLMQEIIKDPVIQERINSLDKPDVEKTTTGKSNDDRNDTSNRDNDALHTCDGDDNTEASATDPTKTKPLIDLSYFEEREKKAKLKQQKLELTKFQLFAISLINVLTVQRDVIVTNVFKIIFACICSYFHFNIVTPFIIAQSIAFLLTDLLAVDESQRNRGSTEFSFRLSYSFIKKTLLDSLSFVFCYTIVQALIEEK